MVNVNRYPGHPDQADPHDYHAQFQRLHKCAALALVESVCGPSGEVLTDKVGQGDQHNPETVSVVLKVQKDSIPASPVPSSEKNACHQYGFSANSIDTSTPALINKASRVDIDADDAREAELNPK